MPATFEVADVVPLEWSVAVDDVPTNATVVLTVTAPDGTASTPTVSNPATGEYAASFTATASGTWSYRWVATGAVTAADSGTVQVGGISLEDVKARLDQSTTASDDELRGMIAAAEREYADYVGPLPGTYTLRVSAAGSRIVLPSEHVTAITAAEYTDGTVIDVDDLDLDTGTGILGWGYNTTGYFTTGTRNLDLTYTVGPLPPNHLEAIIADVAGYFQNTQRTTIVDDQGYPQVYEGSSGRPMVLFPRIRALAPPRVA